MICKGALYDPADGDIDPAQLTQALAKGARDMGARSHPVLPGHRRPPRERMESWIVHTDKGDIRCEIVVNAAGYYAQRVGEWFKPYGGRTVPMMVMSHQYMCLTEQSPRVEGLVQGGSRQAQAAAAARCRQSPITCGRRRTASTRARMSATAKRHWVTTR